MKGWHYVLVAQFAVFVAVCVVVIVQAVAPPPEPPPRVVVSKFCPSQEWIPSNVFLFPGWGGRSVDEP